MAIAGRKAAIKASGAAVAFTNEATTTTDHITYQIANPARRVLDPKASITVKVDADGAGGGTATVADPSTYTIDRLFGKIIFKTAQAEGAVVTVDGSYLPMSTVAEAYEYSWTLEADNQDISQFGDDYIRRAQGQKDASASLSRWFNMDNLFSDAIRNGSILVLEFYTEASAAPDAKMWALVSSDETSAAVDGMVEESIDFEGTTDNEGRVISFG